VPDVALVAQQHGVPFLCLAPEAAMSAPQASTLQIAPGNAERAQELAAYALMQRRRPRAAILAPESAFGRAMSGSFGRALQRAGGSIVSTVTYAPNARTFSEVAKRLAKLDFDTLFVPDSAPTLALVAPALASVGLWSAPSGPSNGGRTILLLSTADGLNARVLADASRYLQQAVLAPGFYPASDGGSVTTLALAYHSALGHWPNLIEAMAFDAIIVLRHHLSAGTTQPSTLLTALHTTSVAGLTGDIQFGGNRKRAIPPPLYEVRGTEVMSLHVR